MTPDAYHDPEAEIVYHVRCETCGSRLGLCIACKALVCKAGGRNRCGLCSDHRSTAYTRVRQRQDQGKPVCGTCGGWPHDGPCPQGESYFPDTCQHPDCENPIWCEGWRDRLYCQPGHAPEHRQDTDDEDPAPGPEHEEDDGDAQDQDADHEVPTTGVTNGEAHSEQVVEKPPGGPPCPGCQDTLPKPSSTSNLAKCEACDEYHLVQNGRVVPWPSS